MTVNILIVDDLNTNLIYLELLLKELDLKAKGIIDINILKALTAKEALKMAATEEVDLIISDVEMPEMDGFELAMFLQTDHKSKDIPVIFLTAAFKSEEFINHGYELGAVDYFTKPIEKYQFLNKISLYLELFMKNSKLEQAYKLLDDESKKNKLAIEKLEIQNKELMERITI